MRTADEWFLELHARASEDPVLTHSEVLREAIPEIQREASEEMRERCAARADFLDSLGGIGNDLRSLPLSADERVCNHCAQFHPLGSTCLTEDVGVEAPSG